MMVLTPASIRYGGHRRHRNGRPIRAPPTSRRVSTRRYVPSSTVLVEGGGVGERNGYGSRRGSTVRSGSAPGSPPILRSGDEDAPPTAGVPDDVPRDAVSPDGPGSGAEPDTATTTTVVSTPAANARPNEPNLDQRETMTDIHVMLVSLERSSHAWTIVTSVA